MARLSTNSDILLSVAVASVQHADAERGRLITTYDVATLVLHCIEVY